MWREKAAKSGKLLFPEVADRWRACWRARSDHQQSSGSLVSLRLRSQTRRLALERFLGELVATWDCLQLLLVPVLEPKEASRATSSGC